MKIISEIDLRYNSASEEFKKTTTLEEYRAIPDKDRDDIVLLSNEEIAMVYPDIDRDNLPIDDEDL